MAETLRLLERQTGGVAANLPHLSDPGVMRIARKLSMFPDMSPATAMSLAYPHTIISKVDDLQDDDDNTDDLVTGALRRFEFGDPDDLSTGYTLADVQLGDGVAEVTVESAAGNVLTVTMPCGPVRTDWRAVYEELLPERRSAPKRFREERSPFNLLCTAAVAQGFSAAAFARGSTLACFSRRSHGHGASMSCGARNRA